MKASLRTLSPHLLDRFRHLARRLPAALPSSCALCGATGDAALCAGCRAQFFSRHAQRCVQCGLPLPAASAQAATHCGECLQQQRRFDATIVASDYAAPADQLVLALKFGSRLALAPLFAHMLRDACLRAPACEMPAVLTAVPLSAARLRERGFNQALEIAKPLAHAIALPLAPQLLARTRDTMMQALLPPAERHQNMRHAFAVSAHAGELIRGRHVGVVDDVMTTGETLNEVAATLKRYGATRVTNFVFARTPPKP
jgi:ComF family protein